MILLFKDNCTGYWLNNTVVDCGKVADQTDFLNIDIPDNISSEELEELEKQSYQLDSKINKKLNKKIKQNKDYNNNEPKYKTIYFERNRKITGGDSGKTNARYEFSKSKHRLKNSNFGINNL